MSHFQQADGNMLKSMIFHWGLSLKASKQNAVWFGLAGRNTVTIIEYLDSLCRHVQSWIHWCHISQHHHHYYVQVRMFAICKICVQDVHSEKVLMRINFPEHGTPVSGSCMMTVSILSTLRVQKFNIWGLHFFKYLILRVHTQPAIHLQEKKK